MNFFKFALISFGILIGISIIWSIISSSMDKNHLSSLSPEELAEEMTKRQKQKEADDLRLEELRFQEAYGFKVPAVICQHCGVQGHVSRKETTKVTKNRVNSIPGKIVGLGTNSETRVTKMHCMNCTMDWEV